MIDMAKKGVAIVICFLIAAAAFLFYSSSADTWKTNLATQESEIYSMQNNIEAKRLAVSEKEHTVIRNTTGLDYERVAKDDVIAEDFISEVMSWDSYADYQRIRKKCIDDYDLDKDSGFLQVFLPEVPLMSTADGKTYNVIDDGDIEHPDGLNIHFEGIETYVRGISTDSYSYFAFVDWSTQNADGREATAQAVFMYDVNSDGEILNVDAYAIAL